MCNFYEAKRETKEYEMGKAGSILPVIAEELDMFEQRRHKQWASFFKFIHSVHFRKYSEFQREMEIFYQQYTH